MDYEKALRSVRVGRARALALRRRGLRRRVARPAPAWHHVPGCRRPSATTTSCSASPRDADEQEIKKAFRELARAAAPGRLRGAGRRGALPRGLRGLRGALEPRDAAALRPLRPRRPALGRLPADALRPRRPRRPLRGVLRRRPLRRPRAAGAARGADVAAEVEIELVEAAHGVDEDGAARGRRHLRDLHGDGVEPGTHVSTCRAAAAPAGLQQVSRSVFGEFVRTSACPDCRGTGRIVEHPCEDCDGGGRTLEERELEVEIPAGIHDGQRIRVSGEGHAGALGGRPATSTSPCTSVRTSASCARATTSSRRSTSRSSRRRSARPSPVETLDGPVELEFEPGTQPGEVRPARPRHARPPGLRPRRPPRARQRDRPAPAHRRAAPLLEEFERASDDDTYRHDEGFFEKLKSAFR